MMFSPPGTKKLKFSHRLQDWRQLADYNQRQRIGSYKYFDLVKYYVRTLNPDTIGKKLLFFSDLHLGHLQFPEESFHRKLNNVIEQVKPDILISGGDTVSYASAMLLSKSFLKQLTCPIKLAVAGNWERCKSWITINEWQQYFADSGFKLLINETFENQGIIFYGLDDVKCGTPMPPTPNSRQKQPTVILAHNPDTLIQIGRREALRHVDLILCGHTHAGQVRLPLIGASATSSRYRRKFDYGLFEHRLTKSTMIVSAGLGTSCVPIRFMCRPEIVLIEFIHPHSPREC